MLENGVQAVLANFHIYEFTHMNLQINAHIYEFTRCDMQKDVIA